MFQLKTHCCGEFIVRGSTLEQSLKNAKSDGISLRGANLSNYWLLNVDLSGMDLRDVDFSGSVLDEGDFDGANMSGAIVAGTHFHGANLHNVNRTDVVFDSGALAGADVTGMYSDEDRAVEQAVARLDRFAVRTPLWEASTEEFMGLRQITGVEGELPPGWDDVNND